ncbi:hypothetical protein I5535_11530 [Rhodobacteraceae bacterium F11138]|nr:hypothetical protein [Rhodobacteraceae bacterium F11138]
MKTLISILASVAVIGLTPAAFAADEHNVTNGLTATGNPLGLHGVDPVSMFKSEVPQMGLAAHISIHDGIGYYFASAETKAAFEADPTAMLPEFGGFCAYGVLNGKKFDGDVRYADVVDGKLYLFVNAAVFETYLADRDNVLAGAYAKWPSIISTPVADL